VKLPENKNSSKVIVDNWTLELFAKVILGDVLLSSKERKSLVDESRATRQKAEDVSSYLGHSSTEITSTDLWLGYSKKHGQIVFRNNEWRNGIRYQMLTGLFQFLDLITIYDELVVDSEMTFVWEKYPEMQAIVPFISKVRLGSETKQRLTESWNINPTGNYSPIVKDGALYYSSLAQLLGLDYWPSPERTEFLQNNLYETKQGFIRKFGKRIDTTIDDLFQEIVRTYKDLDNNLLFPGFGTAILANCDSRKSVINVALEFRETKECVAFRRWLQEMSKASSDGNINFIAKNLGEVQQLISNIYRKLGIENSNLGNVELEIGISPSLKLDAKTLDTLFESIKPKALHFVFLRNHFNRVLENANLWSQAWRLFPELKLE